MARPAGCRTRRSRTPLHSARPCPVIEDDVLDPDAAAGFLRLGAASGRERAAAFGLMTRVAVGHRNESHAMAEGRYLPGRAAGALIAIVGMRAKRDDVELTVRGRRLRPLWRRRVDGSDTDGGRAGDVQRAQKTSV